MKSVSQPSWISRNSQRDQQPSPDFHQSIGSHQGAFLLPPPSPSSRLLPQADGHSKRQQLQPAFKSAFNSVFNRKPTRATSSNSLRSAYSASTQASTANTANYSETHLHPYAAMGPAPLPVVSNQDSADDEEECPVCLEPLSFSFRLPGEKPHIVPECGHALHEVCILRVKLDPAIRYRVACFSAVYGPPPGQAKSTVPRKSNLGVCGVCRRPMKVGDGDGGKSNKLAALTGMGERNTPGVFPGSDGANGTSSYSRTRGISSTSRPYDPTADDPIDHAPSVRSGHASEHGNYIVAPSIQVRPEFSSLTRTSDLSQPLTCIVIIELPGKRGSSHVPGQPLTQDRPSTQHTYHTQNGHSRQDTGLSDAPSSQYSTLRQRRPPTQPSYSPDGSLRQPSQYSQSRSHRLSPASMQDNQLSSSSNEEWSPLNQPPPPPPDDEDSPFVAITEDLRNRITDWKGHPLSGLGPLQMYDLLSVRRDQLVREFFVYLFKEAIICVVEEKNRRPFGTAANQGKGVLRLKGRIYVRHIKQVTASSAAGEMSLTIDMEDERLDSFILIFKERSSLEAWKNNIQGLVSHFQQPTGSTHPQDVARELDMEEFGGSAKAARMLSGSTSGTTVSTADSLLNDSSRSTLSSSTSHGSTAARQVQQKLSPLGEEEDAMMVYDSPTGLVAPHMSAGPSNSLTPLPHPPLDLILVISLPPPNAVPSTAALKIRVIRATLDFILASLGSKDRLSMVTFEVGVGGNVRKTPFLCVGKTNSRARLLKFIEETGIRRDESQPDDEFLVRGPKDEKTDVVTAVNHGLDVVLQRKSRNPVSGLVLVSDAADSTRRAQMDLVLARAEAANIPIHSFGYGRSHDPASLWLMSNHTSGTYTFVKDWYDLRNCVAGCVGGMMSIGLLNMKLHMKIVDGHRFRIRKVSGGPSSILASDGHDVDVDVGELRYGERKEMLIELELDNSDAHKSHSHGVNGGSMSATDQFVQSMGLDSLSLGDSPDIMDGMIDRMIDEVPVVEVDGSFFDPAAAKHITRLAHPVLLTVTLLPPASAGARQPSPSSDPVIVRRRMELLASDMITRALVLVSRKNFPQAQKILGETKRILHTVLSAISRSLPPPNSGGGSGRNRKEILTLSAVRAMQAVLQDLQVLSEALEENVDLFAHDQRNFGAQQAMILRDQKSWSGRSATERLFWTIDYAIELVSRSNDWVARD
ncbi:hypothetical protein PLICRDRAFT_177143 [Plicaturopsis crispa FD-325 SS-3]|nr:hypothetical protein PLICRDRAFT_177143 [Plicaturopsis crispa FD-325 SS-3]